MNNRFKNLLVYLLVLTGIYLLFSISCIILSLKSGLIISPKLKASIFSKQPNIDDKHVIGIISPVRRGEKQQAMMVQNATENLGHKSYVYAFNDLDMKLFIPAKYMNYLVIKILDFLYKTDFHLLMSFHINIPVPEPNIMYISVPKDYLLKRDKLKEYPTIANYNKFLDINLLNSDKPIMPELLKKDVVSHYGLVGIPASTYKSSPHKNLLMFGSIWGRKTEGFYAALIELAKKDYMYFLNNPMLLFGPGYTQKFSKSAYTPDELKNLLNEYGIALCIHSRYHNQAGLPSNRIFEIISSGAIAICDKNPFVTKYFGNNVLYFDPNLSKDEIVTQIDNHVNWIKNHPKEAEEMAQNAFNIIQKKFTTEKFVEDSIDLFRKTIKQP